jgi:hypothetical protein
VQAIGGTATRGREVGDGNRESSRHEEYVRARHASNDPYTAIAPFYSNSGARSVYPTGDVCMVVVAPWVICARQEAVVAAEVLVVAAGKEAFRLVCEIRQNVILVRMYLVLFCFALQRWWWLRRWWLWRMMKIE